MAREAFEAVEKASYERGVQETEARLAKEVAKVCRDYWTEVWAKALNRARVPAESKLRCAGSIFFLKDIREAPTVLPLPVALPFPSPEQISTIQAPSLDV